MDAHFGYILSFNKTSKDFIYFHNYYDGKDVVSKTFNPDFEVEVIYDNTINDNSFIDVGCTMELAIPNSNFGEIGQLVPVEVRNRWAFLAIRQDRNDAEGN